MRWWRRSTFRSGRILNLFLELQRELGLAYVFITHDLGVVAHIADRIAVMYLGKFVELGPAEPLMQQPLHPYTQALLSAEPAPVPKALRPPGRIVLSGEIPSPVSPPSGCRFRTRCRFAVERCAEDEPAWHQYAPGHWNACHFTGRLGEVSNPRAVRNDPPNALKASAVSRIAMPGGYMSPGAVSMLA